MSLLFWSKIIQNPRIVCCRQEGNRGRRRKSFAVSSRRCRFLWWVWCCTLTVLIPGEQTQLEKSPGPWGSSGLCALCRKGGTGGDTEAPVSLWRRRKEMGTDWTHMARMVWAQSAGLLWGAWISCRWHHTQWLTIFRICGNMFWDPFHMLIMHASIYGCRKLVKSKQNCR